MTTLPDWAKALDDTQRAELEAELTAEERCGTCDGRDDQHNADGQRPEAGCFAWKPVQQ